MQKIVPFLWFDDNAEEAVEFYISLFKNSRVLTVTRYDETVAAAARRPVGSVMTILFTLNGQKFTALNGGPVFRFTEAVSFVIHCRTQRELDGLWDALSRGGQKGQCGWLKDRFGVSWQVVPADLPRWLTSRKPERSQRVMAAVMQMTKLDIARLEKAHRGR